MKNVEKIGDKDKFQRNYHHDVKKRVQPIGNADQMASRPTYAFGPYPNATSPKIFGIGLSRTGTTSTADHLRAMGLVVIHFDPKLVAYFPYIKNYSWTGIYDNVDAVFDLPAAFYFKELLHVYPQALFISVSRNEFQWYNSFKEYLKIIEAGVYYPAKLPFSINELHHTVYGSVKPQESLWISNYKKHYQAVQSFIPSSRLLSFSMESIKIASPAQAICKFIRIHVNDCLPYPRSNSLQFVRTMHKQSRKQFSQGSLATHLMTMQSLDQVQQKLQNTTENLMNIPRKYPQNYKGPKYAYITMALENSWSEIQRAAQWCRAVRASYGNDTTKSIHYDVIIMTLSSSPEIQNVLNQCFTGVYRLKQFPFDMFAGINRNEYAGRLMPTLFGAFGFTDYSRIIYTHINFHWTANMDRAFFREYYDTTYQRVSEKASFNLRKTIKFGSQSPLLLAPRELYGFPCSHSPVCTSFLSFAPSPQVMTDIYSLFGIGIFDSSNGWMRYGPFDFSSSSYTTCSLRDDYVMPTLTIGPISSTDIFGRHSKRWAKSDWSFRGGDGDAGALLYYFFLLYKNRSGLFTMQPIFSQNSSKINRC